MDTYTRIKLDVEVLENAHAERLCVLVALVSGNELNCSNMEPVMRRFVDNAQKVLCGYSSYFEQAAEKAKITTDASGRRRLSFHTSLTNYNSEIEAFCEWLAPLIADPLGSVVGEVETEDDKWHERSPVLLVVQPSGIAQLHG